MSFVVFNNPTDLPWQTNVFDVLMVAMFVAAVAYSAIEFRRGRRIYAAVLVAAFVYGLVLELAGMATLDLYQQGNFLIMLDWTAIPLWAGTTMMPLYVVIFYPVFLFTGFKVIEALNIRRAWQAAITGGLFMVALDAPYIVEGNLRTIVWWTWDGDFPLFQFFAGWPLMDLCWQAMWDAVFLYVALRAKSSIDPSPDSGVARWSNARVLGVFPPLAAATVLLVGPVLLAPLSVFTFLGAPQWPFVLALLVAYPVVAITALRPTNATPRVEPFTLALVSVYLACFTAMVIANLAHEGGVTEYIVVQVLGLIGIGVLGYYPVPAAVRNARRARPRPDRVRVSSSPPR